jgi:hypothetical protein
MDSITAIRSLALEVFSSCDIVLFVASINTPSLDGGYAPGQKPD